MRTSSPLFQARSTAVLVVLAPLAALLIAMPSSCGLDPQGSAFDNRGTGGSSATSSGDVSSSSSSSSTSTSGASSSTSTSGASSTSSSSGGTGGAGGAVAMPEDCLDGIDNDLNGLTDCEDPACVPGYQCVAKPPVGWDPVRAFAEPFVTQSDPPCPSGTTPHKLVADPNTSECSACGCKPSADACVRPTLTCWYDDNSKNCTNGNQVDIVPTQDACATQIPTMQAQGTSKASCQITATSGLAPGATCNQAKVDQLKPDPFATRVYTCDNPTTGGGCGLGQICVPRAPGTFQGSVCIAKSGTDACPGNFPNKQVQAYDDGIDQRSCSACSCAGVTLSCATTGVITVTDHDDCGGSQVVFDMFGVCKDVTGQLGGNSGAITASNTPTVMKQGSCTGGNPLGSVVTGNATKICCK